MYSMFPMVQKTYRVNVTEDNERELRFLGQSRIDALTSEFDMTLLKDKNSLKVYELCEKEFYTMKGVTTVNAPLNDVMEMLKMESTAKLREVMGEIFGPLFLDGVVLHKAKHVADRMNESLSVNWMALQSSKPHLPHRDYVFLRYADVFEKQNESEGIAYGSDGTGLYIGASIWESIELDGCAPLPASQNVVRLRLRRCGIVVEELNHEDRLKISFYLSEAHPGRATVSTLTKQWMTRLVSCATEIGNVMVTIALSSHHILTRKQFIKDGVCCYLCMKGFSLLRRKHHCRVCGDVVCSKCSEMKSLKQGGVNQDIRLCNQCRNTTATTTSSLRRLTAETSPVHHHSLSGVGPASSCVSSSTMSPYHDDSYLHPTASFNGTYSQSVIHEDSVHQSNKSGKGRPKTYSMASSSFVQYPSRRRTRFASDMSNVSQTVRPPQYRPSHDSNDIPLTYHPAGEITNDMIQHHTRKQSINRTDRAESSHSTVSDTSYTEFNGYEGTCTVQSMSNGFGPGPVMDGLSEDEITQMELQSTVRENTPFSYTLTYSSRQDWPKAPIPSNEAERLTKVRGLHLIDPGQQFQEMCEYAAAEMGCRVAAICFVGDKSGFLMSKIGLEKREAPRNVLFDAHTIMSNDPTIILDATEDIRFANNPLVIEGRVRFYAGFPLITSDGVVVGSFSVADPFARECLDGEKYFFLKNLAEVVMRGVEENTANARKAQRGEESSIPQQTGVNEDVPPYSSPPPVDMNINDAQRTMEQLLRAAYSTQAQVMQVRPVAR